jgi:quinol monooxygenase YgiN
VEARVITYRVKQGQVDERVQHNREVAGPVLKGVPGLKKRFILVDPAAHKNMTIVLFDNQADMDSAPRDPKNSAVFGRQEYADGEAIQETFHVEHFEGGNGKYARVVSYQIKRGQIDDRMRHWREISEAGLRNEPGQRGRLVLIDRDSHKNLTVSFWSSEAQLEAFEQNEERQGMLAQTKYADGEVQVEHFEVGHEE